MSYVRGLSAESGNQISDFEIGIWDLGNIEEQEARAYNIIRILDYLKKLTRCAMLFSVSNPASSTQQPEASNQ
jgi:hypothetical protein